MIAFSQNDQEGKELEDGVCFLNEKSYRLNLLRELSSRQQDAQGWAISPLSVGLLGDVH